MHKTHQKYVKYSLYYRDCGDVVRHVTSIYEVCESLLQALFMFNPQSSGQAENRCGGLAVISRLHNSNLSDSYRLWSVYQKGPLYTCQALTPHLALFHSLLVRVPTLSCQQFPLAHIRGGSLGLRPLLLTAERGAGYQLDRLCAIGWYKTSL